MTIKINMDKVNPIRIRIRAITRVGKKIMGISINRWVRKWINQIRGMMEYNLMIERKGLINP